MTYHFKALIVGLLESKKNWVWHHPGGATAQLTLFYTGVVHLDPPCSFLTVVLRAMPQMSWFFVTLFLSIFNRIYQSHFLDFFSNFWKNWHRRHLMPKNFDAKLGKIKKIHFFHNKLYFFKLNMNSTSSQLSFEVYNVSVAQNLKFWFFLTRKFFNGDVRHSSPVSYKNMQLRRLFLVSMES